MNQFAQKFQDKCKIIDTPRPKQHKFEVQLGSMFKVYSINFRNKQIIPIAFRVSKKEGEL